MSRRHPQEFRDDVVAIARRGEAPISQVAKDFGCFGETPQSQWLLAHAHEHGWIVRYRAGQEAVTGYDAEPWHLRYVGEEVARAAHAADVAALETLLGLPPAPDY